MAKSLAEILGYVPLTGLIEEIKTGIPDVLPPEFRTITKNVDGDAGRYTLMEGTRQTAKRVEYDAPARRRNLRTIGSKDVKLWHSFETIQFPVSDYVNLRAYDDYKRQEMGRAEVDRQIYQFRVVFDNAELAMTYSMLANGAIYFDANGNLLHATASGPDIDYAVPAANKNQVGGLITSWATASTDIGGQIRGLRKLAVQRTGYPLTDVYYGQNIPSYLSKNETLQPYWARSPEFREQYLKTNEIPNGFLGLNWHPVYESFFVDYSDTVREFFGVDACVFTPQLDVTWYEQMVGSKPVPTTFQPIENMGSLGEGAKLATGKFAYGVPIHDPVTVQIFAGDTRLPVLKINNVIYIVDVTP